MKTDQSVRPVTTLSATAFAYTAPTTIAPELRQEKPDKRRWWNLFVILLAPVISVVDIFITNVSLPTIQSYYNTSDAKVQLIVAAYLIGYAVFLITGSRLGDKFGRKKMLIAGLSAFTVTSVLCGLAATIGQLILFRFLQGMSAAFMVPQTVTLIHLNFPEGNDRFKAFGYYGIAQGMAAILGQFLGGYFIHGGWIAASWRLIFLVNLPIGVMAVVLAAISLKESTQNKQRKLDMKGVILLTLGLVCLIYPLTQGREYGWPGWSYAMLLGSLAGIYIFFRHLGNLKDPQKEPLIDLRLFRIRSFNTGVLSVFFYFGLHNAFLFTCAILLQKGYHISPYTASLLFTSLGWTYMFSSWWSIRNAGKYGIRMLQAGCVIMMASFLAQVFLFGAAGPSTVVIVVCFAIFGLGSGLVLPSLLNVSLKDVPPSLAGSSSGVYSTIQQFSSAAGISMLGGLFFSVLSHTGDYHPAYHISLYCFIVYLGVIFLLLNRIRDKKIDGTLRK
ncbi:MAG: MFS transporter [Chitinophagaceae bacterium]|nr:MFS transporter [Chitinophagaceae bacterium]